MSYISFIISTYFFLKKRKENDNKRGPFHSLSICLWFIGKMKERDRKGGVTKAHPSTRLMKTVKVLTCVRASGRGCIKR